MIGEQEKEGYLRMLFDEPKVVRSIVEAIEGHHIESDVCGCKGDDAGSCFEMNWAGGLENLLEMYGITLEEDPDDLEILRIIQRGKPDQFFHLVEWVWKNDDGMWPWEKEPFPVIVDDPEDPYIRPEEEWGIE